jgi:hypothetical protein
MDLFIIYKFSKIFGMLKPSAFLDIAEGLGLGVAAREKIEIRQI